MAHTQTFAPPSRPFLQVLGERLQPLFTAFRQFTHNVELEDVARKHHASREPLRLQLRAFETELLRLRKAVAERALNPSFIEKPYREWIEYPRTAFYIQLRLLYRKNGFWDEVERVERLSKQGGTYTREIKDEHGNTVGSETINDTKDKGLGNAVEIEFS